MLNSEYIVPIHLPLNHRFRGSSLGTYQIEEQASATNQIQGAVDDLDQTTQQNASMVEEIASSSESLNAEAKDLAEMVRRFKLQED